MQDSEPFVPPSRQCNSGTGRENVWGWKVHTVFNKEQGGSVTATGAEKRKEECINAVVTHRGEADCERPCCRH